MRKSRCAPSLQHLPGELIETIVAYLVDPVPTAVQTHPAARPTAFGGPGNFFLPVHQLQGHAAALQGLNPLAEALGVSPPPVQQLLDPFAQGQGIDAPLPPPPPAAAPPQDLFATAWRRRRHHLVRTVAAPDQQWNVLRLSWTCRSVRAAVLRRLLASNAFAMVDSVLSTGSDSVGNRAAHMCVRICMAKQSHAAFAAAAIPGRKQLPWCSIEIVPAGAAPVAPGPLVDRTLRVPASYITALQFVVFHPHELETSLWPTTCTVDRIADVLPNLRRVHCHSSMPADHANLLLPVVKERALKLTLDGQDAAWLASISLPILQTLILRRSISFRRNATMLPTAPLTSQRKATILPNAPLLRVLRLDAGCHVESPNILLSCFPWLEVLVIEGTTSSGAQTADHVDPVAARLSGQGFDSRLTQVQVTSQCLREWITPATAAALKSLVILGSLCRYSTLPEPAAMTKLTSLVLRGGGREPGKSIMVHHILDIVQIQSLQVFEGDVIDSDLPPHSVLLDNNPVDSVAVARAAFDRVQEQIATLNAPFPALVTVKSSPLFFLVLEQLTLPRLVVAEINFACSHPTWATRSLVLPALPSIGRLSFTPDTPTSEVNGWTLSDPTLWAAQMPRLGQFHCRASFVLLSGFSHQVLHELTMSVAAWNSFVMQAVHLPNLTYLALTGAGIPTLHPLMPGGTLTRVARLSLRTRQMTWAVASDLTRARGLFDIRCHALPPVDNSSNGTPRVKLIRSQDMDTLRLEYTPINSAAWDVVCRTVMAEADVPELIQIDVPANVGMHGVDMDRVVAVVLWLTGHALLPHHVHVAVQFENPIHAGAWVEKVEDDLRAMRVGFEGVSVGVVGLWL